MTPVHLDADMGGDPDDACALAVGRGAARRSLRCAVTACTTIHGSLRCSCNRSRWMVAIKPRRWRRGKSLCAYCGVNVCTDGDHVVADCLYTEETRQAIKNLLTVPACRSCNEEKGRFDGPLQYYLLADVDASVHPEARQLFDAKMAEAVKTNRVRLLDRFYEGQMIPEITASGLWVRKLYSVPIDIDPVRQALVYLVRGLHYLVFDEIKGEDEVAANVIERGKREELADGFFGLGINGWHSQGDAFTVAWIEASSHIYWLLCFFDRVLCIGRSTKSHPLLGPLPPVGLQQQGSDGANGSL